MRDKFDVIRTKLKSFVDTGEDNYFGSDINSLYSVLVNAYPQVPDVKYPFEELQSYSNKLNVAESTDNKRKYYQLAIGRLEVLQNKAEQAGAC